METRKKQRRGIPVPTQKGVKIGLNTNVQLDTPLNYPRPKYNNLSPSVRKKLDDLYDYCTQQLDTNLNLLCSYMAHELERQSENADFFNQLRANIFRQQRQFNIKFSKVLDQIDPNIKP